jgi:hypothetical protein
MRAIQKWAKEEGIDPNTLSVFTERKGPQSKPGFRYRPVGIPNLELSKGMAIYVKEPIADEPKKKEEPARAEFRRSTYYCDD